MNDDLAKDLQESVRDFYERCAASFSRTRSHLIWPEETIAAAKIKPGMTVVDVGAGNGRFAGVLASGVRYIGFEPSAGLRTGGRAKQASPLPEIRPGELPNLPIENAVADATVCFAVFHHIPGVENRKRAVDELVRITKPGGLIAATSWIPKEGGKEIEGGEPGDVWIPWTSGGENGKRYVHVMDENEWTRLWTRPDLAIETITKDRNWFVMARKVL